MLHLATMALSTMCVVAFPWCVNLRPRFGWKITSPFVFAAVPRIREGESDIMIRYDKLWAIGGLTQSYPLPTIFWRTWLDFTVSTSCGTRRCAKKLRWDTRRAQQRHLQKNLCQDVLQRHGDGEVGAFGQVLKVYGGTCYPLPFFKLLGPPSRGRMPKWNGRLGSLSLGIWPSDTPMDIWDWKQLYDLYVYTYVYIYNIIYNYIYMYTRCNKPFENIWKTDEKTTAVLC